MYGECECFVMQMLYVCVHPVAVLNVAFCMTCSFQNDVGSSLWLGGLKVEAND